MPEFGKRISGGLGHSVFEHAADPNRIVKAPTLFRRLFEAGYRETAEDVSFMREHFAPWIPETTVHPDDQYGYVIEQTRLQDPHHVTATKLLEHEAVLESLRQLLDQNRAMMSRYGVSIDTYGFFGLLRSVQHGVVRRVRKQCQQILRTPVLPRATQPELANVLIGHTTAVPEPHAFVVDCSLLHLNRKGLEGARSRTLLAIHNAMLKRQFGLEIKAP